MKPENSVLKLSIKFDAVGRYKILGSVADRIDRNIYYEASTGCWLWGGSPSGNGYGRLSVDNKIIPVHRLQWERFNGPIPRGVLVLHKCDVPLCINPEHLFLGTDKDNMQDATEKGRMQRGHERWNSKLTAEQVLAIRSDNRLIRVIAEHYQVHQSSINDIQARRTWGWLN